MNAWDRLYYLNAWDRLYYLNAWDRLYYMNAWDRLYSGSKTGPGPERLGSILFHVNDTNLARSNFTCSVPERVYRRLCSFYGTGWIKIGFVPTFFSPFQRVNARPIFGTDLRHFFLSLCSFYVSCML